MANKKRPLLSDISPLLLVLVLGFAATAYLVSYKILKENIIQYTKLPEEVSLQTFYMEYGPDSVLAKKPVQFCAKVTSLQKLDKLPQEPVGTGNRLVIDHLLFHQNPGFYVWVMLFLIMLAISAGSFPIFSSQFFVLCHKFKMSGYQILAALLCTFMIHIFLYLSLTDYPGIYKAPNLVKDFVILFTKKNLLLGFVQVTFILVTPALAVMFMVGYASDNIKAADVEKDTIHNAVRNFELLNQTLRAALQLLSIILVLTVLTTNALRQSIHATLSIEQFDVFPQEGVYLYGMYFSLFLFMAYVPIYLYLKFRYYEFKSDLHPSIKDADEKWLSSALDIVKFDKSALENLKTAITMLAPLLSSFLPDGMNVFH